MNRFMRLTVHTRSEQTQKELSFEMTLGDTKKTLRAQSG